MARIRISCALALVLLAACASAPDPLTPKALLQCRPTPAGDTVAVERGLGGTGIDRGMGGTGALALDRGMGGTGIIGTVTGFASICVNGAEVAYAAATPVTVNGLPASAAALDRGMTVAVTAAEFGGQLQAVSIDVIPALVGPVTTAADASGTLAVMGARVETRFALGLPAAALAVGEIVVVDGLQRPDGVIDATRLARAPGGTPASVRGSMASAAGALRVGAVAIIAQQPPPAQGNWAMAEGVWLDGALRADRIVVGGELPTTARVSVEGYVISTGGVPAIRGIPLRDGGRVTFEQLTRGQRVQAIGIREPDGAVRLQRLVVPDYLNPFRAAAPATGETTTRTATETDQLQLERGTYTTTVTRPAATRDAAVPTDAVRTPPRLERIAPPRAPDIRSRPDVPRAPPPAPRRGG